MKYVVLTCLFVVLISGLVGGYVIGVSRFPRVTPIPDFQANNSALGVNTGISTTTAPREVTSSAQVGIVSKSHPANVKKLPLGDNKVSSVAKKGYIYSCQKTFGGAGGEGAHAAGFWIDQTNKTWDMSTKVAISGSVSWPNARWVITNNGTQRSLTGNGLPNHKTGVYPVQSSDPAYKYDFNPNSIKENALSLSLPLNPSLLSSPECVGGEVGVMISGIPLFNGFDATGRDAAAWEVQDNCDGHPQVAGQYHYHSYSDCLKDTSAVGTHSDLLGYAFDGFGLYGLKGEDGGELSIVDLDDCHGHSHEVVWNGVKKTMYHYHMTRDFPYSVGCFRGKKYVTGPLSNGSGGQSGQSKQQGKMPGQSGQPQSMPMGSPPVQDGMPPRGFTEDRP